MAGIIQGLKSKLGVSGKKKYDVTQMTDQFAGMTLKEKLQARVLYIRTRDRQIRLRRNATWNLMALYYQGYQNLDLNSEGTEFSVYEREDFYIENQFRKHVDTVKQMLNKMEGAITPRPGSDQPADIATARVAESVLSSMLDTIGYEKIKDQKNLYKALFGNVFLFNDYIPDKKYGTVVSPKYAYEEQEGPDGEMMLSKIAKGVEKRNKGSEIAVVCSPLEINVLGDIKGGLENLPDLQWITMQDVDTLNYVYPGLNTAATSTTQTQDDLAQMYIETLGNLPGNLIGDGVTFSQTGQRRKGEHCRTWIQPCGFLGDKELLETFPDGAHVISVNGSIVDWYNEDLRDRWTHEVLIPVSHSMLGDGLYDAVMMQDQINEINSLLIAHLRFTTHGHKMYDGTMIDPKDVVNAPKNEWIKVTPGMDKRVADAVKELQPGSLSSDVAAWLGTVKEAMQDMTSAYDPSTGKGIGANTPYSQSVFLNEKAQGRWSGSLSYNKPEVIRFHRQLLQLARDNWIDPRKRSFQDNVGQWSFEQFSQADLQGQVDLIMSDNDMMPRSRAEQIQGLQMWATMAEMIGNLPPKQRLRIEEILGLPPNANPMSSQIARAYRNIDRIKKGEVVTPLPMVDDASSQIPVYQDWLAGEDAEAVVERGEFKVYADVYTLMVSLSQMGMMQMGSPVSQVMPQHGGPQKQVGPQQQNPAEPPKQPGGQVGQPGGGPSSGAQPNAQSPAQPAPPVSPPNA